MRAKLTRTYLSVGPSPVEPTEPEDPEEPENPNPEQDDEEQAYSVLNAELTGNDGDEVTLLNKN